MARLLPPPAPDPGLDPAACHAAMRSRDPRFDGQFVAAVASTGIYCRPSCPALTPRAEHVAFVRVAAAAQAAGYRACKRCCPDAAPGSAGWDPRQELAGRAVRLIEDGVVDRLGVTGLAAELAYSPRQLRRLLLAQLGAGPLALARAQRARTARLLLGSTDLPVTEVAFAAGFGSVRQCNETVRAVYAATPGQLRGRSAHGPGEALTVRLAFREPGDVSGSLAFLGARAVPGVESYDGLAYSRSLGLPHGEGVVRLSPEGGHVRAELHLADLRDLAAAVARCRRLLDLDADPLAVAAHLGADPLLAPLIEARPGRRVPGCPDGAELAVRAVVGQQVSLAAARALAGRLVAAAGKPLTAPRGAVTHLFPTPEVLAGLDPATLPLPRARARALVSLAAALAGGLRLDPAADRHEAHAALRALPGIGGWTARYVLMRGLGDPDVLLTDDLVVRRAAGRLGLPADPAGLAAATRGWAPWRSYATAALWAGTPA